MNRATVIFLITAYLTCSGLFTACGDFEEKFSTNPAHTLSFSNDTIAFDTVFTTIGSATRQLMVYNRNKEPLNIASIQLVDGAAFRLNVDGRSGQSFSDVCVLGKDSLFILVEVTVNPAGNDQPVVIEDMLEFTVNGNIQPVILTACGQDVNLYKGGHFITQDTTWTSSRPYLVYDSLVISERATLTIEQGAILYMHHKAKWIIEGTLQAEGTVDNPVIFRGDRLDRFSENLPYDRLSGQWGGMYFSSGSFNNTLNHVIIRNGNNGLSFAESVPEQSKLKISNSQITNMDAEAFHAVNCNIEAVNTEFSNSRKTTVMLEGGEYRFIHCTFANFYTFTPGRDASTLLYIRNSVLAEQNGRQERINFPLKKAVFINCIIDGGASVGSAAKPLDGELKIEKQDGADMNYSFSHCVIKTKEVNSEYFTDVSFIPNDTFSPGKPQYKSMGDSDNEYFYDFRINLTTDKEGNPVVDQTAIGKADPSYAGIYPADRYGTDRLTSKDGPDIGAYEYVPDPEEDN
jgi:hypothetical protein